MDRRALSRPPRRRLLRAPRAHRPRARPDRSAPDVHADGDGSDPPPRRRRPARGPRARCRPALRRMLAALHQLLDIELAIMLETYRDDLLAKNRTAERLATIGQFAAGIGHELRNPLGVVESSAYLVSRRLEQLQVADPGVTRHMEKIATEVQRSGKTINDLLELARSRPPARRRVDARDFVAQAIPAAHLPATTRGHERRADGAPARRRSRSARPRAHEPAHQRQSGHATEGGPGHVWIDARREGTVTVLRVRDDGPGIPAHAARAGVRGAVHHQGQGQRPRPRPLPANRRGARGNGDAGAVGARGACSSSRFRIRRPVERTREQGERPGQGHCSPRRRERFCRAWVIRPGSRTRRARHSRFSGVTVGATSSTTSVS